MSKCTLTILLSLIALALLVAPMSWSSLAQTPRSSVNLLKDEDQAGDPLPPGKKPEHLTIPSDTKQEIENNLSGESLAAMVPRQKLALAVLDLAKKEYAGKVSRKEPPKPSKVRAFLGLYGLDFKYNNG